MFAEPGRHNTHVRMPQKHACGTLPGHIAHLDATLYIKLAVVDNNTPGLQYGILCHMNILSKDRDLLECLEMYMHFRDMGRSLDIMCMCLRIHFLVIEHIPMLTDCWNISMYFVVA